MPQRYKYYRVTKLLQGEEKRFATPIFDYLKACGNVCWIEQTPSGLAVWRMGVEVGWDGNKEKCEGVIVKASHPDIEERIGG